MSERVCLVTSGHLSTNPRLVKEADALASSGYDVSIVCARFAAWADRADREFESRPWHVRKIAFGPLAGPALHIGQGVRRYVGLFTYKALGRSAELALHPATPALSRAACERPADLYIAHNLPALPAAARAATIHHAKLGFDAEDFHRGELTEAPGQAEDLALTREIEDAYLRRCDYLTAASPGISEAYTRACGVERPTVILNVFPKTQAPPSFTSKGVVTPGPSLYWFSQTVGPNRGLETVVEAVARSKSRPTMYLRGTPTAACQEALVGLAARSGVGDRIVFLPPTAPGELVRDAARYDVGLACEVNSPENRRICLTNKLFTYLLAGIPVLASDTPAQARMAAEMGGAAIVYGARDPADLARAIDGLFGEPETLARARQAAWTVGQNRFNWEIEGATFLDVVRRVLTGATGGPA